MRLSVSTVRQPNGTIGRRYCVRGLSSLLNTLVFTLGAFVLLLGPVPNPNFSVAANVAKGVLLDAAAIVLFIVTRRYVRWLGLTVWEDGTVFFRFYLRSVAVPAREVLGLRLMTGWPWRTLLEMETGVSEAVHGLPAAPPWLSRRRQRAEELVHLVWNDIRAAAIGNAGADNPLRRT